VGVRISDRRNDVVRAVDGGVVLSVRVVPRAGKTEFSGRHGDALKLRVAAPPVDGRANEAARAAIAAAFGLPLARVELVGGEHSRAKQFALRGLAEADALARIAELHGHGDRNM
jgi:hypothetical protein